MLDTQQLQRYSRQVCLPEIGLEGQEKICQASVLVIGMGGLGSPAALYLAAAGIQRIGLADFDDVELHNLQRQIIHYHDTIGQPKVESAAARLKALNPELEIKIHEDGINTTNALQIFSQYDIIIDGCDNFSSRYLNNDAAYLAGVPLVYGSIFQFEGQVSLFDANNDGPCYRCLFPQIPEPGTVPNCAQAGVFGALCGVVGSMQALEAIKYIADVKPNLVGRLLVIDSLQQRHTVIQLKKDPDCPLCGPSERIFDLRVSNYNFSCSTKDEDGSPVEEVPSYVAKDMLDKDKEIVLIDVREDFEREICAIENSLHIPLGSLSERSNELDKNKETIIYCHHGMRSLKAANMLAAKGFKKTYSMQGGIDQWAQAVDGTMARY